MFAMNAAISLFCIKAAHRFILQWRWHLAAQRRSQRNLQAKLTSPSFHIITILKFTPVDNETYFLSFCHCFKTLFFIFENATYPGIVNLYFELLWLQADFPYVIHTALINSSCFPCYSVILLKRPSQSSWMVRGKVYFLHQCEWYGYE